MSDIETVALVIAAALGGVGTGLGVAIIVMRNRADDSTASHKAIDAYARWVAARKRFTRSCWSLVVAKRTLRFSEPKSSVAAKRRADVNRIREEWRRAAGELDTAEAVLIAWSPDLSTADQIAEHPRCWDKDIQTAADAHSTELDEHYEKLEEQDRLAVESLRPRTVATRSTGTASKLTIGIIKGALKLLDDIAARWARP